MIRIAFRFDDPSETSHQGVEQGIIEVLRAHHTSATFACIPFRVVEGERVPLSRGRAAPLIEAERDGTIEVALHGHSHLRHTTAPAPPSEFAGRSAREQATLIQEGAAHLAMIFGERPAGFVPPWNSFDQATLAAVEAGGFTYISAGERHLHSASGQLQQVHRTSRLAQIDAVARECERFRSLDYRSIFVMHHYDFFESGSEQAVIDLEGFQRILARLGEIEDLRITTLRELARTLRGSASGRSLQHRLARKRLLRRFLPHHGFVDAGILGVLRCGLTRHEQ